MGGDPDKNPPFFFTKPADAILDASRPEVKVPYPQETEDLQFEVELVVALGKGASLSVFILIVLMLVVVVGGGDGVGFLAAATTAATGVVRVLDGMGYLYVICAFAGVQGCSVLLPKVAMPIC